MRNIDKIRTLVIHGGKFHADDVMTCALLRIINPELEVIRTNTVSGEMRNDETVLVADIGLGEYDHHQKDVAKYPHALDSEFCKTGTGRETVMASCGLVFRDFWDRLFDRKEDAETFRDRVLRPIEKQDNAGKKYENPVSRIVECFNPAWDSDKTSDEAFWEAETFCETIVRNEIRHAESMERGRRILEEKIMNSADGIIVMERYIPWQGLSADAKAKAKALIFPSRGGYSMLPIGYKLPEQWIIDPPEGCTFVHPGRFIAAFKGSGDAVKAIS